MTAPSGNARRIRALTTRSRESIGTALGLLRLLHRCVPRRQLARYLTVAIVTPMAAVAMPVILGHAVTATASIIAHGWAAGWQSAVVQLALLGTVFLAQDVLGAYAEPLSRLAAEHVDGSIRTRIAAAVLAPDRLEIVEDPVTARDVAMARDGLGGATLGNAAVGLVANLLRYLETAAYAVVVAFFSVPLAVGLFVVLIVARHMFRRIYDPSIDVAAEHSDTLRRAEYLCQVADGSETAREVRILQMHGWLRAKIESDWRDFYGRVWRARDRGAPFILLLCGGLAAAYIAAHLVVAAAALDNAATLAATVSCLYAMRNMSAGTSRGDATYPYAKEPLRALNRLEGINRPRAGKPDAQVPPAWRVIQFTDVTFRHRGAAKPVLDRLNLTIRSGQSLAVAGVNGAGKSTLVKLLAGLYVPDSGRITVDGVDITEIEPVAWRRTLAVLSQDFAHYPMTLRDNVAMGRLDLGEDMQALAEAARKAGVEGLVGTLPHGWDTLLDPSYTGGVDLSGGQWQRVGLARVLLAQRGGADLLVLDEPTASLDVHAEAALVDRWLAATVNTTSVVISHRFTTVRHADRIVVLDGGRIAEDGSHESLMAAGGRYAEMYRRQVEGLRDKHRASTPAGPS